MTTTTLLAMTAWLCSPPGRRAARLLTRGWPVTLLAMLLSGAAIAEAAPVAAPSPLAGTWTEIDGPGAARIAPCADTPNLLCAIGLDRRRGSRERVDGAVVLSQITPAGANRWRGRYHDGGQRYGATLRLLDAATVEMKVCILFVCQSARYARTS